MTTRPEISEADLAIDLVSAGQWLHKEHRFRPRYYLPSVVKATVALLGDRIRQYALSPEYLRGIEDVLSTLALIERKKVRLGSLQLVRQEAVAEHWREPRATARLCARSAIVSVLRHFTGSAVELTSGGRGILVADTELGMDGLIDLIDGSGHVRLLSDYFVSWTEDMSAHRKFLQEAH